jgi:hypothetical protein
MALKKDTVQQLKYVYDFAVDGGAVGAIPMRPWVDGVELDEGVIVMGFSVYAEGALTSGGTPTVTIGNTLDPDGYSVDAWAVLSVANATLVPGQLDGALTWNTTNDAKLAYRIGSAANVKDVALTVGTAALTGGKLVMTFDVMLPSGVAAA